MAFFLLLGGAQSTEAQNFNPNNFDAVRTMGEVLHPHSDLVIVASHRGNHALVDGRNPGVPENSLEAIGLAAQAGSEEIEIDVKLTSDGVPIMSHDQTWGRETCYRTSVIGNSFDPFTPPGNSSNDADNPAVNSVALADMRSYVYRTFMRDSISLNCFPPGKPTGNPYPPTLQDVLDYMTANKIAMVLALDIRDASIASSARRVIGSNSDYMGRNYLLSTMFKVPAKAFASPQDVERALPPNSGDLTPSYFQPVYNTGDIAPGVIAEDLEDFGGVDVGPAPTGYGSEQGIIDSLHAFENDPNINVAAVEVQIKQYGGILTQVLDAAKTNSRTGQPESVTVFSPYADYYAPDDTFKATPLYFKTTGYCCQQLSDFYYKGTPAGTPPFDSGDSRPLLIFLNTEGFNSITTDDPDNYNTQLASVGKRNLQYLKPGGGNGGGGGGSNPTGSGGVCDIYASGGTSCVAAHSTVRALFGGYGGKLYQVKRASDGTTTDVGTLSTGGYADAAKQDSFCTGTTCTITEIYDQSSFHNDLAIEGGGGAAKSPDSGAVADALPIKIGGHAAYGIKVTSGVGYRNNAAVGTAKGGSPEGMYIVTSGTYVNGSCCFDYGNAETNSQDTGNGHMDALNFGTACVFGPCSGSGPWVEADLENGQYMGNGSNLANPSISSNFVTAILKNNGRDTFSVRSGDATTGGLTTGYSGTLPTINPGYIPMSLEGAIVLGTGGDNSNGGVGAFFEGVMTAGYPSNATEDAVQANIVAAGYSGSSGGSGGGGGSGDSGNPGDHPDNGGSAYTGPSDPGGPGPQDGFNPTADLQPDVLMGSKPAIASFNESLFIAFQADDAGHTLHVTSSTNGNFGAAAQIPDVRIGSAPAMAVFNKQLFLAFRADDAGHTLHVTSSSDGHSWPAAAQQPNIQIGSAPAMAVFKGRLYLGFQSNDGRHLLFTTSSSDGQSWPNAAPIGNVNMGSAPAMAVFNDKLYVAFRADDGSNAAWVASSSDGVNFTPEVLSGQTMGGSSAPALVVSGGTLYYIYGADDTGNEMMVSASTDGSTWQGPAAYLYDHMGSAGPGAAAFDNGVIVGFQSNDARNVLFVTRKLTEASGYTGPNDPGGPGPQDGFQTTANEQADDAMGSKPALASFNKKLYVAFQANDPGNTLQVASSSDGNFSAASQVANIKIGSAPAMADFNKRLYLAFQANDPSHTLYVTSSSDGQGWPDASPISNIQIGSAPAMAVFNKRLYLAFQSDDGRHLLFTTSSSDGESWPGAAPIGNVAMGSAPAMATFNNKLYVAFRANDATNAVWIASSSDGVTFSPQVLSGQSMGTNSAPALVASGGTLYCIYGANDANNEMLVTASTNGSTWQGPAAYTGIHMGATGPAAAEFVNGASSVYVGFQSNDDRHILFATDKVTSVP